MNRRRSAPSGADLHRAWLELVDADGPFLSVPVLKRAWPTGMLPPARGELDALRDAKPAFEKAWDQWDINREDAAALERYREARDAWVEVVLRKVLGWKDFYDSPVAADIKVHSPDYSVTVTPTGALVREDTTGALVLVTDPVDSLRDSSTDGWAASPVDRMEELLRTSGVPIGVVTDGRWWAIISARPETMVASGIVDAQTWIEAPATRNAFIQLLRLPRLIGRRREDLLTELFGESVAAAEEITEALGTQVRRAVELLVQAMSEAAIDARHRGEPDPLPATRDEVYQAAVTVMMQVVFLLFAEERGLLPQGRLFTEGYGISDELDTLDARAREEGSEALDASHLTWYRLLATSQALYRGASFEDLRLPSYGGSLFDPSRFGFLTARDAHGTLTVTVSDRVMLEVLKAVQMAKLPGEPARRISFRDIDVEQIGYIYEGLLGYSCKDVEEITVGLIGKEGEEPEIPLAMLEDLSASRRTDDALAARSSPGSRTTSLRPCHGPGQRSPEPCAIAPRWRTPTGPCARWPPPIRDCATGSCRSSGSSAATCATGPRSWSPAVSSSSRRRPAPPQARTTRPSHWPPRSCGTHSNPSSTIPVRTSVKTPGDRWTPTGSSSSKSPTSPAARGVPCRSGPLPRRPARRGLAPRRSRNRHDAARAGNPRDPHRHRHMSLRGGHQRDGRGDVQAVAVARIPRPEAAVLLRRRQDPARQLPARPHRRPATQAAAHRPGRREHAAEPVRGDVDGVLRQAARLRRQLANEVNDADPQRSMNTKRRQWHRYQELTAGCQRSPMR